MPESMIDHLPHRRDKRNELRASPENEQQLKDEENPSDLASALKKAKVSGKRVKMIER